jgi:lysophospholipase L1-like esterase
MSDDRSVPIRAGMVAWLLGTVPYAAPLFWQGPTQRQAALWLLASGLLGIGAVVLRRWPVRVIVAAVALGMVWAGVIPTTGRTLPLVAGLALVLALIPGRSSTAPPPRPLRTAAIALAGITWLRERSLVLTLALLGGAMVVVLVEWVRPSSVATADATIRRIATRLGEAASYAVVAVVALPVLFLPSLVGAPLRQWQRRRRLRAGTGWRDRSVARRDERRDAIRPFAPAPVRQRRLLNAAGAIALLGSAGFLISQMADRDTPQSVQPALLALPPATTEGSDPPPDPNRGDGQPELADRPAFAGVPWARAIEEEFARYGTGHLPFDEELGYVAGDFDGVHLNVRGGARVSLSPTCDCPRVRVWLLGGSTAFGWNQRDEFTIASYLVRIGEELGIAIDIENFAVPGWTIDQEWRHLERLLDRRPPPDVVLFYDGFNDAMGAVAEAAITERPLDVDEPTRLDSEELRVYSTQGGGLAGAGGPGAVGLTAADRYAKAQEVIGALLAERDIPVHFALQGDAFASTAQLRHVEGVTKRPAEQIRESELSRALDAFGGRLDGQVIDVRGAMAEFEEPIFSDPVHTNELGARIAAEAIMRSIGPTLLERAR